MISSASVFVRSTSTMASIGGSGKELVRSLYTRLFIEV